MGKNSGANVLTASKSKQNFKISRHQLNKMVVGNDEVVEKKPYQRNAADIKEMRPLKVDATKAQSR